MASEVLLIYCTCPDQKSAGTIATRLIDDGLAACVNILPGIESVYRWAGKREHSSEYLLLIKTSRDGYPALERAITALHPYELPEIVAVPVEQGLPGYLHWIKQCVK